MMPSIRFSAAMGMANKHEPRFKAVDSKTRSAMSFFIIFIINNPLFKFFCREDRFLIKIITYFSIFVKQVIEIGISLW